VKVSKYLAAALAIAGVVLLLAGPLWVVIAAVPFPADDNLGLGDGTVRGPWQAGQLILMVLGAVLCMLAVAAAVASRRD
jgi:hypothetical protein